MILVLCGCFLGIFFSYLLNGYTVEYLTVTFGKDIFSFYLFMILSPALFNTILAKILILLSNGFGRRQEFDESIPKSFFFFCSVFQTGAMIFSNASLAYITYPTQLILKSTKPLPVLCAGVMCLSKRVHHISRIASTLTIVCGVMGFMYLQYVTSHPPSESNDQQLQHLDKKYMFGLGLVFASLLCDGILGYLQEKARRTYSLNALQMFYTVNIYSTILLSIGVVLTNEFATFAEFFMDHPNVVFYLFMIGMTGAVGQSFIYYTVIRFGPLTCSIITNVRKFFQIFLSVFLFSHLIIAEMWLCVFIIFSGLSLDIWSQYRYRT